MSRLVKLLTAGYTVVAALVFVPSAFATAHNGEGIWGPTTDQTIMFTMFIIMGLLILIMIVFSLLQSWLEHRKYAKIAAAKGAGGDAQSAH